MTDLLDGIARHLDALGLVAYDPDGITGDLFVEAMPPAPDEAVVLTLYDPGIDQDSKLPQDDVRLQVRARGGPDPRVSRARVHAIYSELHGLARVTLPDGTYVVLSFALSTPFSLGADEQRRHEHSCNFQLTVSSDTTHRT
jgi:hypothetical protein